MPGEFAQIPVLPKWLLIVLAALLALLLAWFALVRPAVKSTAEQAGTKAAQKENERGKEQGSTPPGGAENPAGGQGEGPVRTERAPVRAVPGRAAPDRVAPAEAGTPGRAVAVAARSTPGPST